jgi:3-oxoacid CoA-transferase subunit A
VTSAEVEQVVAVGEIDPDAVHSPSIYVKRLVLGKGYVKPIERRTVRRR